MVFQPLTPPDAPVIFVLFVVVAVYHLRNLDRILFFTSALCRTFVRIDHGREGVTILA
jgi:hypothetical protein